MGHDDILAHRLCRNGNKLTFIPCFADIAGGAFLAERLTGVYTAISAAGFCLVSSGKYQCGHRCNQRNKYAQEKEKEENAVSNQKQIARKSKAPVDLGTDVNDPLTWPTYTGRVTLVVTKEVFDLAGKVLVVSAFSVLGSLSSPGAAKWVPGVLAVLLGLHVTYRTDIVIAELFAWMKAKGPAMLLFYTVLTATVFVSVTITALTSLMRLTTLVAAVVR